MVEETPKARPFVRRRQANTDGGKPFRFKVGVSAEDGAALTKLAVEQGVTVPRLMVESALSSDRGQTPTERREVMAKLFAVHRLLATLSNNVNQIARAVNTTGELQEDLVATLAAVRRTAERVDDVLEQLKAS